MNRRQRRQMEKKMGITKYKQSMTSKEKINRITKSSKEGKEKEKKMKETLRIQNQKDEDQKFSNEIASLATTLTISENLSYIEALEKAKKSINKNK